MAVTQTEVAKLYVATFNRAPDAAGLDYWTNCGLSLEEIAQSFFDQSETQTLYPTSTANSSFVTSVYDNLFNRTPDQGGLDYWVSELNSGRVSKQNFILAVINGALNTETSKDATILTNKQIVGLDFVAKKMDNVDLAKDIMAYIDATTESVNAAIENINHARTLLTKLHMTSTSTTGVAGNNSSDFSSISADGRYVVFKSAASNLVAGDTNGTDDFFFKDTLTGVTTKLASWSTDIEIKYISEPGKITADGKYVVFSTAASDVATEDTNGTDDIFLKNIQTGKITLVSKSPSGEVGNDGSWNPSISASGRYVTFQSEASNLVAGDNNNYRDIFLKDTQTGVITMLSKSTYGVIGNGLSYYPNISENGRYVVFGSWASNLVAGDNNNSDDIFLKDIQTGQITLISKSVSGVAGNNSSWDPSVSADGRYVTFTSDASNLVTGDTNSTNDIFLKDTLTGAITIVSQSEEGVLGNDGSWDASISADGRYVVFDSDASTLVAGDTNNIGDVFLKDTQTGQLIMLSKNESGVVGDALSYRPAISSDGKYITFSSKASNLVDGDTKGTKNIFTLGNPFIFGEETEEVDSFFEENGGYLKFLAKMSSAVYLHTGVGDDAVPTEHSAFNLNSYLELKNSTGGFHFFSSYELGLTSGTNQTASWTDSSLSLSFGVNYNYDFSAGFYGTDETDGTSSAYALVGCSDNALFISFRGTDGVDDMADDAFGMHDHYAMYGALLDKIEYYIANHSNIKNVYVTGHSLGGQMGTLFMLDHPDTNTVNYHAVLFEPANKLLYDNDGDPIVPDGNRILTTEMAGDWVADTGLVNSGTTIDITFSDGRWISLDPFGQHYLYQVAKAIDSITKKHPMIESNTHLPTNILHDNTVGGAGAYVNVEVTVTESYDNSIYDLRNKVTIVGEALATSNIAVIDGDDGGTYTLNSSFMENAQEIDTIIIAADTWSFDEDVNYSAEDNTSSIVGKTIIGNDGDNILIGGGGNDILVGQGGVDRLAGGLGDDILYGSGYSDSEFSITKTQSLKDTVDTYTGSIHGQDISYLAGEEGNDSMYGSRGSKDYFFIDVNLSNNASNVDTINNFCTISSGFFSDDYLVFSGEQLGIDIYQLAGSIFSSRTILGNIAVELSSLNFQVEDSITNSLDYGLCADQGTFILCENNNGLYFDKDGENSSFSPILVSIIGMDPIVPGNLLSDICADRILLML